MMRLRLLDPTPDPEHLALVLDAGPGAAPQARGAVVPLARSPQEAGDLGLVVSEVIANAVRHGSDAPDAIILLSVLAAGDAFVVTASNEPAGDPCRPQSRGHGMGLEVLRALGADVEVRHEPGRTVATCRLPRGLGAVGVAG
jgi:anti-sigma regulatory factor (Ser/Thr protein kinase)